MGGSQFDKTETQVVQLLINWLNMQLRSREEQGGAEEIDKNLSQTRTNSETQFRPNNIMIEFSLITATFWIPHTSFYVKNQCLLMIININY